MQQGQHTDPKEISSCIKAKLCGSCAYIGVSYEEQLLKKQKAFNDLMKGIDCDIMPIIGAKDPYNYRNKVHAAFGREKGKVISGTYAEGSHRIISNDSCIIEDKRASAIIKDIRKLAVDFKLQIYDERNKTGILRRVLVRVAVSTGEILVVLVNGGTFFPGKKNFIAKLTKMHPEITTVVININKRTDSMILGDKSETVYGKGFITDELCGLKFRISAQSFYQINHDQTERLYTQGMTFAALGPKDKVLDAYCGIGTIGMVAAKIAGEVVGVELNKAAVSDAITNKRANGMKNISFVNADATRYIEEAAAAGEKFDVVFLDPPRSGTTIEFIRAVSKLKAKRVVYISCSPDTLARDLRLFSKNGYKVRSAVPVDMFPWTDSTEAVAWLEADA